MSVLSEIGDEGIDSDEEELNEKGAKKKTSTKGRESSNKEDRRDSKDKPSQKDKEKEKGRDRRRSSPKRSSRRSSPEAKKGQRHRDSDDRRRSGPTRRDRAEGELFKDRMEREDAEFNASIQETRKMVGQKERGPSDRLQESEEDAAKKIMGAGKAGVILAKLVADQQEWFRQYVNELVCECGKTHYTREAFLKHYDGRSRAMGCFPMTQMQRRTT